MKRNRNTRNDKTNRNDGNGDPNSDESSDDSADNRAARERDLRRRDEEWRRRMPYVVDHREVPLVFAPAPGCAQEVANFANVGGGAEGGCVAPGANGASGGASYPNPTYPTSTRRRHHSAVDTPGFRARRNTDSSNTPRSSYRFPSTPRVPPPPAPNANLRVVYRPLIALIRDIDVTFQSLSIPALRDYHILIQRLERVIFQLRNIVADEEAAEGLVLINFHTTTLLEYEIPEVIAGLRQCYRQYSAPGFNRRDMLRHYLAKVLPELISIVRQYGTHP